MPVLNINNKNSFSSGFNNIPVDFRLHKVDDDTLKDWAWQKSQRDISSVSKNATKVLLVGVPVVDTFLTAASTDGSLSCRVSKASKTAGKWGIAFGVGIALIGAKHFVANLFPKTEDFNRKHPVISSIADCTVVLGAYLASLKGANKVSSLVKDNFKEKYMHTKNAVANSLNSSVFNKKVVEPLNNHMKAHYYSNKTLKAASLLAVPVMLVSSYLRYKNEVNDAVLSARKRYSDLQKLNNLLPEE